MLQLTRLAPKNRLNSVKNVFAGQCRLNAILSSNSETKGSQNLEADPKQQSNIHDVTPPLLPEHPTWSVRQLLASYPAPSLDDPTLDKLHQLGALIPPEIGTEDRETLRMEMNNLIKLVNAVRLAPVPKDGASTSTSVSFESEGSDKVADTGIPDGRIYPIPQTVLSEDNARTKAEPTESDVQAHGRDLLKHSQTATSTAYVLPDLSKRLPTTA